MHEGGGGGGGGANISRAGLIVEAYGEQYIACYMKYFTCQIQDGFQSCGIFRYFYRRSGINSQNYSLFSRD